MDYEVWLASGRTRADNAESVARGLARTGRGVTAAALLMAVTFASLMVAEVSVMRIFGVGLPLAVVVDATLVRMLLLPASLRLLGRVNWWVPPPLARLHQRFGFSESADQPEPSQRRRPVGTASAQSFEFDGPEPTPA
jgi:putative drug exporter of the RND superfamily